MTKENNYYKITFLRHAESVGNADGYHQGQSDFPLTERGHKQAHALATRWREEGRTFDHFIASPLSRTRTTAQIIAGALDLDVQYDSIWMERHVGEVTGLNHEEAQKQFPQPDFSNPYTNFARTGEGDWELYLRAGRALKELLEREPGRYLVVSHGGLLNQVIKAIVGVVPHANYQGPQFRFGNTAFATVSYVPNAHRWYIEGLNDQHHWRKDA